MIALIGLILIIVAWLVQLVLMDKNNKIYLLFVVIYCIGVVFLVYDGFSSGLKSLAWANLVSLVVSLAVLIKLKYTKRK